MNYFEMGLLVGVCRSIGKLKLSIPNCVLDTQSGLGLRAQLYD